ncbi:hypothetical protein JAAARDRAFT_41598 [Jaapia argillacea MUCL 33604]|uniref:Peptidase M20 dimerisation domain-containing protein n=1 Tax=Jaapia argillacea MUCL 33604 TaxID=933084 RepID=A0A067P8A1_9AGAM|nr:hypothetical protein JAAARDRAFT_41598 [Jaapia argillacea MUCL 33604]
MGFDEAKLSTYSRYLSMISPLAFPIPLMSCCQCSSTPNTAPTIGADRIWARGDEAIPPPSGKQGSVWRPDVLQAIEAEIDALDNELRTLSLNIHDHPELKFEEKHAHDTLTTFMERHGFEVTTNHLMPTAWLATFTHGNGGRTLGVNSEMDALPGIGHACGHNLIAIAGVAVALAAKATLVKLNIPGSIRLLGTPGEEGGSGKVLLLDQKGFEGMDACLMCHPAPGPQLSASLSSCLAIERLIIEFTGHTAHAALSPWEGQNALDAAVLAYTNIGLLRQQLKPTHRVHAIIEGKDWAPNIIPDYAKVICYVRAPTLAEVEVAVKRVKACFEAAALATACQLQIENGTPTTFDLRQNKALGDELARIYLNKYGPVDYEYGIAGASTDFGNVTYALPSLHPGFAIPTVTNGGNHTVAFTESAATPEAHDACLKVSKALAATGIRVIADDAFFEEVKRTFEEDRKLRGEV